MRFDKEFDFTLSELDNCLEYIDLLYKFRIYIIKDIYLKREWSLIIEDVWNNLSSIFTQDDISLINTLSDDKRWFSISPYRTIWHERNIITYNELIKWFKQKLKTS